jgi:hypothetical protein
VELKRTPYEAVISASISEIAAVRTWLLAARAGDRLELASYVPSDSSMPLLIQVTEGRGFWARWDDSGGLLIDVGVGGLENFGAAFEFLCEPVSGAHCHFDPPAFPEEENDGSVPLVIAIA